MRLLRSCLLLFAFLFLGGYLLPSSTAQESKPSPTPSASPETKPEPSPTPTPGPMSTGTFGGLRWRNIGPAVTSGRVNGFAVDPTAYGYSRGIEMPDGSVYVVYQGTGGHKLEDARDMTIYGMRLRVAKDGRGVSPLPREQSNKR